MNTSALQESFRGRLIGSNDDDHDEARTIYNAMIDKRPRLIARRANIADVLAAVRFGRDEGLDCATRGGEHNGLTIDTALVGRRRPRRRPSGSCEREPEHRPRVRFCSA